MTTSFSSLPIVDLKDLAPEQGVHSDAQAKISEQLYDAFATTGFAYLVNAPLTFNHQNVFDLVQKFFNLPTKEKMKLAKKTFNSDNINTYRGYFPVQPLNASDNLKEGFEMGPANSPTPQVGLCQQTAKFDLSEPNVWPDHKLFPERVQLEQLYDELQALSSKLLSLLAVSLDKESNFFDAYLEDSLSTLRLLHYPLIDEKQGTATKSLESLISTASDHSCGSRSSVSDDGDEAVKLSCTPHTDSGILTLLHQDPTGGLEVRNSLGHWVPAPYVPGSIVVNIGDLMAEVSGGRFVATMHRVRAPIQKVSDGHSDGQDDHEPRSLGRLSVPFFFEPGEHCIVRSAEDDGTGHGILYGEHVRSKMSTWVEFQDPVDGDEASPDRKEFSHPELGNAQSA